MWPLPERQPCSRPPGRVGPLVTVVVPCYNHASCLPAAVASVISQTFQHFELVIVDDGSDDESLDVARELVDAHPLHDVRILSLPHSGEPSLARNAGIGAGRAKYIVPLDADDVIAPTFLERTIAALEVSPHLDVAYTDALFVDGQRSWRVDAGTFRLRDILVANQLFCCAAFTRRIWEQAGGYKPQVDYEDWEFWLTCAEAGALGERIAEPLFMYRVNCTGRYNEASKRDLRARAQLRHHHAATYAHWEPRILAERAAMLRGRLGPMVDRLSAGRGAVAIYGAGEVGRALLQLARERGVEVRCFVDRSTELLGGRVDGLPVLPLDAAFAQGLETFAVGSLGSVPQIVAAIHGAWKREGRPRILSVQPGDDRPVCAVAGGDGGTVGADAIPDPCGGSQP